MENIQSYIVTGFQVAGALVIAATAIVKLTPSQADDNILAKIVKVLDWLSVVNPNKPKA